MNNYLMNTIGWNVSNSVKVLVTKKNFLNRKNFNLAISNNSYERTKENIKMLCDSCLPSQPIFIKQAHGKKIINLNKNPLSCVGDGIITSNKNQVISVLTADCMPIIISSIGGEVVCILHVGRKGAQFNIINNAFKILNKYKYEYEAWIGPSITKDYYLVDSEIKNSFLDLDSQYSSFFSKYNNMYKMDLVGIATFQLSSNKIKNIFFSNLCTVKNNDEFFSHRKNNDNGRFGTFVWIE
tara:strand:- start:189 stop:905 length:717 start_codon:yes stop_codon:yes gene_type:complete